jgi:hypothetical protein
MAPGILLSNGEDEECRPSKRSRIHKNESEATEVAEEDSVAVPTHPLGVKPAGNAYTSATDSKANIGSFSRLPDELVAHLLESLEARDLLVLGATCQALHAFCRTEDLWKALFIE